MLKTFIIENTWLTFTQHGFGNGYVVLPEGHKYNGTHYDDIPVKVQEIKDRQPYNHEIEQLHHQFFRDLCKMNEKPRVPTGYREETQEEKSEKLRLDAVRAMNNLRRFVRNNA